MANAAVLNRRHVLGMVGAGIVGTRSVAGWATDSRRLTIGGTGASLGTMRRLAEAFKVDHPEVRLDLPSSLGTTGGMRAVLAGAIDIATSVRPVTAEEAAAGASAVHYARSPFGFVTSHRNPPDNLTTADIVDIFALKRRTWPDGTQIRVVLRTRRDGDSLFIIERFPATEAVLDATHAKQILPVAQTDQINLDMAEKLEGSFTTSTIAAVISEERHLRILNLDGVAPTLDTIASGAYPHVRPLYFVTTPATSEAGRAFIDFVRSPRGAEILVRCGNAPVAA